MFTKQHYKEIADIFHCVKRNQGIFDFAGIELVQKNLCKYFESDNSEFDAEKFNEACKP